MVAEALRPSALDSMEWERGWCGVGLLPFAAAQRRERPDDESGPGERPFRWFKIKERGGE